jgi:hypothetical protein
MTLLVGLDLDATRALAVAGPEGPPPASLPLDGPHAELPLAVCLEGRQPQVGPAALTLCRRLPDFACLDFLPHLGGQRLWQTGRHRLDAARALGLNLEALGRTVGRAGGVAAAPPAYLTEEQLALLAHLAGKARWRLLAWLPRPLAFAWAGYDRLPWSGRALVLDVDGHALGWSAVAVEADRVRLLAHQSSPGLGRHAWMARLLDGVAGRCVRQSRRDPRESPEAEQYLFDQLRALLEAGPAGDRPVELVLQTSRWYQRVSLPAGDLTGFCAPLAARALRAMEAMASVTAAHGPVGAVMVTAAAARLPGLTAALERALQASAPETPPDDEDFGEGLLQDTEVAAGSLSVLDAHAACRAAHNLAVRVQRGDLPAGGVTVMPLPPRGPSPRLHDGDGEEPPGYRIPFPGAGRAGPGAGRHRRPHDSD